MTYMLKNLGKCAVIPATYFEIHFKNDGLMLGERGWMSM